MHYARVGQKGYPAWRLVLITLMQFNEGLSDREAADAGRGRIDWMDALGLALEDAGFHYSILSEFRERMIDSEAGQYFFEMMVARCQDLKLVKAGQLHLNFEGKRVKRVYARGLRSINDGTTRRTKPMDTFRASD